MAVSETRRDEMDLPSIWLCPPDGEVDINILYCAFESSGRIHTCDSGSEVDYAHIGGSDLIECAAVSMGVTPFVSRFEGDRLLLRVGLKMKSGGSGGGGAGVAAVIGRNALWGNQWFVVPTRSFSAIQLARTERYEFTSPFNSEVYHDYDIFVSQIPLRSGTSFPYAWPPSIATMESRAAGSEDPGGYDIADLQIQYQSLLIQQKKVSYKYPPIAEFARIFGPIGAAIGLYKAYSDWRRRSKRHRTRSDSGIDMMGT